MPNNNNLQEDEATDFSGYFKKPEPIKTAPKDPAKPITEETIRPKLTKRVKYLVLFLVILIIAQCALYYYNSKTKNPGIPAGYKVIESPKSPPKVVPIKP